MPLLTFQSATTYNLLDCLRGTTVGIASHTEPNLPGSASVFFLKNAGGGIIYIGHRNSAMSTTDYEHILNNTDDQVWNSTMMSNSIKLEEIYIVVSANGTKMSVMVGTL